MPCSSGARRACPASRLVLTSFLLVMHSPQASSQDRRPGASVSPGVELIRDVEYGTGGERPLLLHVILPSESPGRPMPAVVWIHGGAWRGGSRDGGIRRLMPLVRRGYVGASIEYRLSGEATFPAQIEDCKAAIRFLRSHAAEYGIDARRIGVWGDSAGGHLAALLGTSGGVEDLAGRGGSPGESDRVQAVCDFFGPTDLLLMNEQGSRMDHDAADSPESLLIGGPIQALPGLAARANPITYVSPDDPPFLLVHGDRDELVPLGQSELLRDALRAAGVPATLHVVEGGGHGQGFPPEVDRLVVEFFDRTLRGEGESAAVEEREAAVPCN
ncbi:alpha/beta hydrolase [Tautonia plasticadhaerens]|uniref:Carboxylesterase NlhH n=1 Tax=Tautonia plasticadhaerens TaxID=2527974 RepID=A0A518H7E3_9BACT|nr:alpha/beta hydrolase [Tautonia plasticadhaerens]QDV36763.1 Carboxylesterase NlhH [Tautonia plasticadhaerens]